ncbi:Rz1 family lipoprotein [Escherichia coli]|nr:Rz1 family lipoprotein [Escherichia coli]
MQSQRPEPAAWAMEKAQDAYFHERRSLNNFHRDRVITFEQIAE